MRVRVALAALGVALVAWLGFVAIGIVRIGQVASSGPADAAIVLGAAIRGDAPSPVFQARIDHGITLYRTGRVRRLILTGGYGEGLRHAESAVARAYALRAGIPATAMLAEDRSRTTGQNLREAAALMRADGLKTALIVSDPLHLKRALRMAADQGIAAKGAPTPTTRYRNWSTQAAFLLREVYYYNQYLVTG